MLDKIGGKFYRLFWGAEYNLIMRQSQDILDKE
jgi:hypothetical protein